MLQDGRALDFAIESISQSPIVPVWRMRFSGPEHISPQDDPKLKETVQIKGRAVAIGLWHAGLGLVVAAAGVPLDRGDLMAHQAQGSGGTAFCSEDMCRMDPSSSTMKVTSSTESESGAPEGT